MFQNDTKQYKIKKKMPGFYNYISKYWGVNLFPALLNWYFVELLHKNFTRLHLHQDVHQKY